jgi:hypothetical protein
MTRPEIIVIIVAKKVVDGCSSVTAKGHERQTLRLVANRWDPL